MPTKLENIPLNTPTKMNGEWFYRTRHSLWVLRLTEDTRLELSTGAKRPCWIFHAWTKGDKDG